MPTLNIPMSSWQYSVNGTGWQQGYGQGVSVGVDGSGNVYRGYVAFDLSDVGNTYYVNSATLTFKRADNYGTKHWSVGLLDKKPTTSFSISDFAHTVDNDLPTTSNTEYTVTITDVQLNAYKGKTMYVLFCAYGSGNSYGEISVANATAPKVAVDYALAKSTLTASDCTAGTSTSFTITRVAGADYTHKLTATVGNNTETIVARTDAYSSPVSWTPAMNTYAPLIAPSTSASVTYTLTTYTTGGTAIGTDTVVKTMSIPAKSTMTTSNGYFGEAQAIAVTRNSNSYRHTLTAECGGITWAYSSGSKVTTTSITWTPAVSTYADVITDAQSATVTYTLTTYLGTTSTVIGTVTKTRTLTFHAYDIRPTLSFTVTDPTGNLTTYGAYVVGKSRFLVTPSVTVVPNAIWPKVVISANGTTYSYTTTPVTTGMVRDGSDTINCKVTDSRSMTASASTTVTLLPWSAPSVSMTAVRCDIDGTENPDGANILVKYNWAVSDLNNQNSKTLVVKHKLRTDPDSAYVTDTTITLLSYTGNDSYIIAGVSTSYSYTVLVELSDDLDSTSTTDLVTTAQTTLDLYNDGTGAAFGKVAESGGLLDIAWDVALQNKGIRLYDSNKVNRAVLNENGNMSLRDSAGNVTILLRGDGGTSTAPLPITQGGTDDTGTHNVSVTTTNSTGTITATAKRWGNVVNVILVCKNSSAVSAMNYLSRGTISGVPFPADTTVSTTFSSGDLCACSINSSGTITARVMVGSVSANTNRTFAFTYLV